MSILQPAQVRSLAFGVCLLAFPLAENEAALAANPIPAAPLPGSSSGTNTAPTPALPGSKTRADEFRELLAMSSADRAKALASRAPKNRAYLEQQLHEFEVLPSAEREARLEQLQLACHMMDLMKLPAKGRAFRLALVPPELRPIIDERLREWDKLPSNTQKEVLDYQTTANFFLRVRPAGAPEPTRPKIVLPPGPTDANRQKLIESFTEFLDLPPTEREKTLQVLPPAERKDMKKTLDAFAKLGPEARKTCIASYERFSQMTPDQRREFLKNAERWKSMSPQERETWRTLVNILPAASSDAFLPPMPVSSNAAGN